MQGGRDLEDLRAEREGLGRKVKEAEIRENGFKG